MLNSRRLLITAGLLAVGSIPAFCQGPKIAPKDDPIEALVGKWDVQCSRQGCSMFKDVLVGDPDHPADLQHPLYITITVAVDRATQKPSSFAFNVPRNRDSNPGLSIAFAKTLPDGDTWTVEVQPGIIRLPFGSCSDDFCIARVKDGIVTENSSAGRMDLLGKFQSSDHVLFLFMRGGEPRRTIEPLFPFKKAYKQLLETEFKKPN